jgi:hypothetical protein
MVHIFLPDLPLLERPYGQIERPEGGGSKFFPAQVPRAYLLVVLDEVENEFVMEVGNVGGTVSPAGFVQHEGHLLGEVQLGVKDAIAVLVDDLLEQSLVGRLDEGDSDCLGSGLEDVGFDDVGLQAVLVLLVDEERKGTETAELHLLADQLLPD